MSGRRHRQSKLEEWREQYVRAPLAHAAKLLSFAHEARHVPPIAVSVEVMPAQLGMTTPASVEGHWMVVEMPVGPVAVAPLA